MPQYQQVSGGACSLVMYRESSPGVVAPGSKGVRLALYSEGFKSGNSKKARTVINGKRGSGKPYAGLPQMSGQLESAAYAPQLGHLLRALCNAPASTAETARTPGVKPVTDLGNGKVGIPCTGHGFVQDAVITVAGTTHYNGIYRVEAGVTADVIAIAAPFTAETLTAAARVYRGRAPFLSGEVRNMGGGLVGLPVVGMAHALNAGETVTVSGTTSYNGTYELKPGTGDGLLVVAKTFTAETFDGKPVAVPAFYRHVFTLPKRQPTVCMEKHLDFETGAAASPYRRFGFCKVNGLNFAFGGEDELKFSLEFAVGRETSAVEALDATPAHLPAAVMDNIETSVWIAGVRRGDVQSGNFSNTFGIEPKAAVGDLGQYSRMPEGDPDCKATMSVFLETDDLQRLVDARATVPFALAVCAVTGDEVWFRYPEMELDSDGPAISGKAGIMQDFTAMAFVDRGESVLTAELINRVPSYA